MIHNTPEGNQLLRRTLPLDLLLQGFAMWLAWRLWGSKLPSSEWTYVLLAIGISNLAKVTHHVFHRFYVNPKLDGYSNRSRLSLLLINACIGLSWGFTLYSLEIHLPGSNSSIAVASFALLAGLVGSALWEAAFAIFAIALLAPQIYIIYQVKEWTEAAPWMGLIVTSFALLYLSRQWQTLFNRYRQTARQNSGLLQELALAKKQMSRDHDDIAQAHEKLKQEMDQRSAIEQQIRASERETTRILQDMQDTYVRVDHKHNIQRASPSIHFLLGISANEINGMKFNELFVDKGKYDNFILDLQRHAGLLHNHESQMQHRAGHPIWVSINAHYSANEPTGNDGFEGSIRDISESKKAEEILYQEKNRLHVTLESIGDGVITTDNQGVVTYLNPAAETITGWTSERAYKHDLATVLKLVSEETRREIKLPLIAWIKEGKRGQLNDAVTLISQKNKREYAIELTGSPIRDSRDRTNGYVIVFRNMTKLRTLTKQLTHQATHDALTGLINRKEFDNRVSTALHSATSENKTHALCYVDLDQFKIVNDTCGHHAGDLLLQQVTQMLQQKLRSADTLARLGGDEFGVLIHGCDLERAKHIAESIREAVEKYRFNWENRAFRIGASIGLVSIDKDSNSLEELLSSADAACYVAKENGRNRVHVLEKDDQAIQEQQGQMNLMQRLQRALEFDHFELYMQQILPLNGNQTAKSHIEILLRLRDDSKHNVLLPPGAFLSTAERYHLMPKIDEWVIENTFHYLALAQNRALIKHWKACSINLSGQTINEKDFIAWLKDKIKQHKISPQLILFEISETDAVENQENLALFTQELGKLGCRFALDDFGSGLSAFSTLSKLKLDMVKIDGELIQAISDPTGKAIVEAITNISHVMNLQTVAEHVEKRSDIEILKAIGVDFVQGIAIDMPAPLLDSQQSRAS